MAEQYKRRLIPIVDRAFQFKYTAIILFVAAVTSTVLGVFLLKAYKEMNEIIGLATISPEIGERLDADDTRRVFTIIVASLVAEVAILGVLGLLITHRVCGPIFVVTRHFQTMAEGRHPTLRPLRTGDEFASMFVAFKHLIDEAKRRDDDEAKKLSTVVAALKAGRATDADAAVLQALVDERTARLQAAAEQAR
jgi:signal transduction histidine kinase